MCVHVCLFVCVCVCVCVCVFHFLVNFIFCSTLTIYVIVYCPLYAYDRIGHLNVIQDIDNCFKIERSSDYQSFITCKISSGTSSNTSIVNATAVLLKIYFTPFFLYSQTYEIDNAWWQYLSVQICWCKKKLSLHIPLGVIYVLAFI